MHRLWATLFAATALSIVAGCGREKPPADRKVKTAAAPVETVVSNAVVTADAVADAARDDPPQASSELPAQKESAPRTEAKASADAKDTAAAPERIALLTPGGPLLMDVRLTIDDRPHTEVFEAQIDRILKAADTDGDGQSSWKELIANRPFLEAELPSAPPAGSRQAKMLIERYDENRDGRMQPGEAASWLGRDAGVSARAFSVRSSRSYRPMPHRTSSIWQLLDADHNGRLSAEEIHRAPQALWSFDADDERTISPSELLSLREQLEAAGPRRMAPSYAAEHYAAIHLEPQFDLPRLEYLLGDLYATRQVLEPESFPELTSLFHQLDADGDGLLAQAELARLLTMEPHLELSVAFHSSTASGAAAVIENVDERAAEIRRAAHPAPSRLVLSLGATRLVVSAYNLALNQVAEEDGRQSAAQSQIRLMVHDQCDALFEALDKNADGKLGEREVATCAERLLEWDGDGDGQLANHELPSCMVAVFLFGERSSEQSFYLPPPVAAMSSGLEVPPWFLHADFNGDGDVSRREFLGSPAQFLMLDGNKDGFIEAMEAAGFKAN